MLSKKVTFITNIRYEIRDQDMMKKIKFENSGSNIIYITPQITVNITKKWFLSATADYPFYKYYKGIQLGTQYSFAINLLKNFNL